jgi:hypothetical protein
MTQQIKPSTASPEGRQLLEQAIECLVALLDLQDGEPDREPSLGSTACTSSLSCPGTWDQSVWAEGERNECEEQCEDEGAQCEDEGAQDDREPDVDNEPDYPRPPKGYMHPEDLGRGNTLGLESGRAK